MCSTFSAIDQRSGAGLKLHCASDRPFIAPSMPLCVCSRYNRARSRCADVNVSSTVANTVAVFELINVDPFCCESRERIAFTPMTIHPSGNRQPPEKISAAHEPFNPPHHARVVRPSPEHPPAVHAAAEFGFGLANARREQLHH